MIIYILNKIYSIYYLNKKYYYYYYYILLYYILFNKKKVKATYIDNTNISARVARLNPSWNGDNSEDTYYVKFKKLLNNKYILY